MGMGEGGREKRERERERDRGEEVQHLLQLEITPSQL
jgi:hypothetical protein